MNSGIAYLNLRELSNEEYSIVEGEADITGWPVTDEGATSVGRVRDLLFDPEQNAIRYLVVDLDYAYSRIEDKAVLFPIGFANLGKEKQEVIIPVLHEHQIGLMPQYIIGEVTRNTEEQIRSAIGSPAALRIEEEITELEHTDFYNHHHFDRGNIITTTKGIASSEMISDPTSLSREDERNTIQALIENTEQKNSQLNETEYYPLTANESFSINVNEGKFTVAPQENGTYRIIDGEKKIGVIYAESGQEGSVWRTMDNLDDNFVLSLGNAITRHNS